MTETSSKRDWNALSLDELFDELCLRAPTVITQQEAYKSIIGIAKQEDLDEAGDITSRYLIDESQAGEAVMRSREAGRLAGLRMIQFVAARYDSELDLELLAAGIRLVHRDDRTIPVQYLQAAVSDLQGFRILGSEKVVGVVDAGIYVEPAHR